MTRKTSKSYQPPWWLSGGHRNTIWATLGQSCPMVSYRRERLPTEDGDFVDLDCVDAAPGAPRLLVLHGLEGNSHSPYVLRLVDEAQQRGWGAVVLHARGCSGEDNRRSISYNAGFTRDIDWVVRTLVRRDATAPLLAVAYSLGGSQLANYLGRAPERVPSSLKASYLVSTPFLLEPGAEALKMPSNQLYTWYFLRSLRRKLRIKSFNQPLLSRRAGLALRTTSIEAFDHLWTGPIHGYAGSANYYREAASAPYLEEIRVPTRVLHAADDPFVPPASVPQQRIAAAPHLDLLWLDQGGHVGFVSRDDSRWLEHEITDWLAQHLERAAH